MPSMIALTRQSNPIVTMEEVEGIFSNLKAIYNLNKVLLSELEELYQASEDINSLEIGPVFLRLVRIHPPFFYCLYLVC